MRVFVEQLVNGLTLGSFFGLIALGYSMVYGVLKMINFVHGDFFTLGSYLGYTVLVFGSGVVTRDPRRVGRAGADRGDRGGRPRRHGPRGRAHRLQAGVQGGPSAGRRVGPRRLDHRAEPHHARLGAALPGLPRGGDPRDRRAARAGHRHADAARHPRGLAAPHGGPHLCHPEDHVGRGRARDGPRQGRRLADGHQHQPGDPLHLYPRSGPRRPHRSHGRRIFSSGKASLAQ